MPNPNPKLENLKSYKPKWQSGKTRTIRVPIAIADRILEVAHQIDEGSFSDTSESIDKERAKEILTDGLAIASNKGGEIKTYLAELGKMLGFEIKKNSKKQWIITDTTD